ncbi:MAG: hypothetical protein GY913_11775 [Proteobacteria bacterium]|nr:hypothetical protein [Pseudomonadota bacterium]MCP4917593.1 hypothetical protein [Pseudomonadota bacterium]
MRDPWFDKKGLDFEEDFARVRHERVSEVLGKVTPEHWREQRRRVLARLAALEGHLDDVMHARLTEVFLEYDVLVVMTQSVDETVLHVTDDGQQLTLLS